MYESDPSQAQPDKPDQEEGSEGETALLPKSIFMGKDVKVGDTKEFEVVHIYSDEVEVRCKGYSEDAEPAESEPSSMGDKIDKMGEMNG